MSNKWLLDEEIHCLRTLGRRVAEIAGMPIQQERAKLWTLHNDLKLTQPLVFIDPENGWYECIPPSSLVCRDPLARSWEMNLRQRIYWFEVLKDDHVIDDYLDVGYVSRDTGWGVEIVKLGGENGGAYRMKKVIEEYEEDFDKLHYPKLILDWEQTERNLALAHEVFDGILNVRLRQGWWWSLGMTWDYIDLRGLEEFLCDFILEPDWVHRMMDLLCRGQLDKLDFLEKNGLLSSNTGNTYIGSGGLGFTSQLPDPSAPVRTMDMWGFVESQETSSVNPDTYGEFIFPYHKKIAEHFGLNCYGCCEPANDRWKYVSRLPRLRRVSYSPWADWETARELLGKNYVTSLKPIPTPLATANMDETVVRRDIRRALAAAKGCIPELVMKDTNTLGHCPRNAVRWVEIAREEIDKAY